MSLTRRATLAGAAGLAGLTLTQGLPIDVAAAAPTPRTHNEIIAAMLRADEPGPEAPQEVRMFWRFVRCTPDELDFLDAFVDAAVECFGPDEFPGAEGARYLIAMARPEPTPRHALA